MKKWLKVIALLTCLGLVLMQACGPKIPPEALELSQESLKDRQLQTRKFDTNDEAKILAACAALIQDLGFTLEESETDLGVIVATKKRDATSGAQVVGAVILAALTFVVMPIDDHQIIRSCVVTYPSKEREGSTAVRVTFQRVIYNTMGHPTKMECIMDEKIYQEFFDKLSQSIFLEAHQI